MANYSGGRNGRLRADFRLNRDELGRFVSRAAKDIVRKKADQVVEHFRANAPVGPTAPHWRDSLSISESRETLTIKSSDPAAVIKELGARGGANPAFRTMLKALESVGE